MAQCGNFLDYAGNQCNVDVGFGKMFLLYATNDPVSVANLTADAINTAISDNTIIGVIKGWHTLAGASVAEVNSERASTGEMVLLRPEIPADTMTFEANIQNRTVIADLVKAGKLYGVLLDDMGNVVADEYVDKVAGIADSIVKPMLLNFTTKSSSSFQKDRTSDKSIAVTVRYFVENPVVYAADIDVDLIDTKELVRIYVSWLEYSAPEFKVFLIDNALNKVILPSVASADITFKVNGVEQNLTGATVDTEGGITITTTTPLPATAFDFSLKISTTDYYTKEFLRRKIDEI